MVAGLLVQNNNDKILIDSNFINITYEKTIKGTGNWSFIPEENKIYAIVCSDQSPSILVPTKHEDWHTEENGNTDDNGNPEYDIIIDKLTPIYKVYGSASVLVFNESFNPINYGLQVMNEQGVVVYQTNSYPLKIIDYQYNVFTNDPGSLINNDNKIISNNQYSVQSIAVIIGQNPTVATTNNSGNSWITLGFKYKNNILETSYQSIDSNYKGTRSFSIQTNPSTFIYSYSVIDITNLKY